MRMALAAILAWTASSPSVSAQTYVRAGTERGQAVAVNERVRLDEGVVQGEIIHVPLNRRGRAKYSYAVADFDCERRTRSMRLTLEFSSTRDPVQTSFTPPFVASAADYAVAEQIRLICEPTGNEQRFTIQELIPVRPQ